MSTTSEPPPTLVLDANIIIDLVKLGCLSEVLASTSYRFVIPRQVLGEIRRPEQGGVLAAMLREGFVGVVEPQAPTELAEYARLKMGLGDGEAAGLACAAHRGWVFASDEKGRKLMREAARLLPGRPLVRTPALVASAVMASRINIGEVRARVVACCAEASSDRERDEVAHVLRVLSEVERQVGCESSRPIGG